jgi:hypothetical protein
MPRKKKLTIKPPSQIEALKGTPSELAKQALLKSGAGAHGERRKHNRRKDRQEERDARLEGDISDRSRQGARVGESHPSHSSHLPSARATIPPGRASDQ